MDINRISSLFSAQKCPRWHSAMVEGPRERIINLKARGSNLEETLTPLTGKFQPPVGQNHDARVMNSSSILNLFKTVKLFQIYGTDKMKL